MSYHLLVYFKRSNKKVPFQELIFSFLVSTNSTKRENCWLFKLSRLFPFRGLFSRFINSKLEKLSSKRTKSTLSILFPHKFNHFNFFRLNSGKVNNQSRLVNSFPLAWILTKLVNSSNSIFPVNFWSFRLSENWVPLFIILLMYSWAFLVILLIIIIFLARVILYFVVSQVP